MAYTNLVKETFVSSRRSLTADLGLGPTSVYNYNNVYRHTSLKSGVKVGNYKALIRQMSDASSFYSVVGSYVKQYTPAVGIAVISHSKPPQVDPSVPLPKPYVYSAVGAGESDLSAPNHMSVDVAGANSRALSKLLKKVREDQSHMQGLVFLGELRETVRMFRSPYSSAVKIINRYLEDLRIPAVRVKQANDRVRAERDPNSRAAQRAKKHAKAMRQKYVEAASSAWLETTMGLLPLISDVKDAAETAARWQTERRATRVRAVGSSENELTGSTRIAFGRVVDTTNYKIVTKYSCSYVAGLKSESSPSGSLDRLRELSGLTVSQFVPTAWELLPWSFLVDYFTNIGETIENLSTDTSSIFFVTKTSKTQTVREKSSRLDLTILTPWEHPSGGFNLGTATVVSTAMSRQPLTAAQLGVPPLRFKNPFGKPVKVANMIALLEQQTSFLRKLIK